MERSKDNRCPQPEPTPSSTSRNAAHRIIRRLQGEDGYDIFTDSKEADTVRRLRQERDDNRW